VCNSLFFSISDLFCYLRFVSIVHDPPFAHSFLPEKFGAESFSQLAISSTIKKLKPILPDMRRKGQLPKRQLAKTQTEFWLFYVWIDFLAS
jgi:hypothetical protein